LLKDCYRDAIAGYDAAGKTVAQANVDRIKALGPISLAGVAIDGADAAAAATRATPQFQMTSRPGILGPATRRLGVTGVAKEGLKGVAKGVAGAATIGLTIGSSATYIGDYLIGRESFLRDAIKACNAGNSGASKKVDPGWFGIGLANSVRSFLGG
jgi:hypothetical protein